MQWSLKQKGWRAVLVRMVLLALLWLVVAFVFATEFYLSARTGPIHIPWSVALSSAIRDWFPWILLSPVAVLLAGRFRFSRDGWRLSLVVHLIAAIGFTFAYQALLVLAAPAPFFYSTGGVVGMSTDMAPRGFSSGRPATDLPALPNFSGTATNGDRLNAATGSNFVTYEAGNVFDVTVGPDSPPSSNPNQVFVVRTEGNPAFAPPPGEGAGLRIGLGKIRSVSKWSPFLHMAMMRTQFTIPIYLCIVCVCWVINHFQEASERERRTLELESRLTEANLQALKMQLQPHFLFNTLNSISSLIHENPKAADDMIGSLSQFLRTTLDVSTQNEVPLRTEVNFVDRYLEIQQTRFGDRLRVERDMGAAVMDALVPPLILQPLVENAIRYGIESRATGGTVTIRAQRENGTLHLEISDDGEGFSGGHVFGNGSGIGLSNTKARLQELYGESHQFKIMANHPKGACVKIEIPFQPSARAEHL